MKVEDILIELKNFAQIYNLVDVEPRILSESSNLIVHLFPYDIVAKVAVYDSKTEAIKDCINKEITIANYLKSNGVPAIRPVENMNPGPYECLNHWFSLWQFVEKIERGKMTSETIISSTKELITVMSEYTGSLPTLGVWHKVQNSALNLSKIDHLDFKRLLEQYDIANQYIMTIKEKDLVPSHGDSHVKNLFPTLENWIWMDFEDVSLMPKYWDLASVLANIVLFNGVNIPVAQAILNDKGLISGQQEFLMILKARVLMSIIGNLDMALQGLGDLEYAEWQLGKFEELFKAIDDLVISIKITT